MRGKVQRSDAAGRRGEDVGGSRCLAAVESSMCLHLQAFAVFQCKVVGQR